MKPQSLEEQCSLLSRNVRSNVRHKIYMALILGERSGMAKGENLGYETVVMLDKDANTIGDMIAPEYVAQKGAGALWLDKKLKDLNWLAKIQEDSWKLQREKKLPPRSSLEERPYCKPKI